MSTKIKCRSLNSGTSMPVDKTGLEWAANAWAWLIAYTDSHYIPFDEREYTRGKVIAVLRLLHDMGMICDTLFNTLQHNVEDYDFKDVAELAHKQLGVVTTILCR